MQWRKKQSNAKGHEPLWMGMLDENMRIPDGQPCVMQKGDARDSIMNVMATHVLGVAYHGPCTRSNHHGSITEPAFITVCVVTK